MAAPKGHPRYGGRRQGSRNKALVERDQALARAYAEAIAGVPAEHIVDLSPLEAMLLCMQWALQAKDRAGILAAAAAAAPYVHARLTSADLRVTSSLANKTDEELAHEAAELEARMAAARVVN